MEGSGNGYHHKVKFHRKIRRFKVIDMVNNLKEVLIINSYVIWIFFGLISQKLKVIWEMIENIVIIWNKQDNVIKPVK